MNRMLLPVLLTALVVLPPAVGCHGHGHDHGESGVDEERPTVAVTNWTDLTELFMEYPVLVARESGRAAIHVTDLKDFSPLVEGEVVVVLSSGDGRSIEFRGGLSRPGIFGVDLAVDAPGIYEMALGIDAPGLKDTHDLGPVTVHPTGGAPSAADGEEDRGISFLKEQQWNLEFGTERAAVRPLRPGLVVPAVVQPRAGRQATVVAPVPGRTDTAPGVPVPGARVRTGALLARIIPGSEDLREAASLRADLVRAEQDHLLAARERDRARRLVDARAVPSRRFDEAEAALASSEARLEAARQRWSRFEALSDTAEAPSRDGAFNVRAPFDGVVSEVGFAPGMSVAENQFLMKIVDPERVEIVGAVPESRTGDLTAVSAGELLLEGADPVPLPRPLSVGRILDAAARTAEVRFPFDNRDGRLLIGQSVRLRLFTGEPEERTSIPEAAVIDDGGSAVVFVQRGGESFERRAVRLGTRAGGWVHVIEGVEEGERVVSRGAYLIRLAAMSTQIPAHGHLH